MPFVLDDNSLMMILCYVDLLLGKELEISNYKTSVEVLRTIGNVPRRRAVREYHTVHL
jgi:hypothetical protein